MDYKIKRSVLIISILMIIVVSGCKKEYEVVKAKPVGEPQTSQIDSQVVTIDYDQLTLAGGDSSKIKSTEKASVNFTNAITYQNSKWRMSYYLGKSYLEQGEFLQAVSHLENSLSYTIENENDRFKIYVGLANCYEQIGRTGKAILAYHTASNIHPDSKEVREGLLRLKQTAQLE